MTDYTKIEEHIRRELNLISNSEIPQEIKQKIHDYTMGVVKGIYTIESIDEDCAKYVKRLVKWKPISPLTGEDDEWECLMYIDQDSPDDNTTYQNKRCASVFKIGKNGRAHYLHGRIFQYKDGKSYQRIPSLSSVYIDFPYEVPDEPQKIKMRFFDEKTGEEVSLEKVRY